MAIDHSLAKYIELTDKAATNQLQMRGIFETENKVVPQWIVLYMARKAEQMPGWPLGGSFTEYADFLIEYCPEASHALRSQLAYHAARYATDELFAPNPGPAL